MGNFDGYTMYGSLYTQHVPDFLWSDLLYDVVTNAVFNPSIVGCPPGDTVCEQELATSAVNVIQALVASAHLPSLVAHITQQIGSGM